MDRADEFVHVEDTLRALNTPRRFELEQAESSSKKESGGIVQEKVSKKPVQ